MSVLFKAFKLLASHRASILVPPRSEVAVGLIASLGGWQVGLGIPTQVAVVRSMRVLFQEGPPAFLAALRTIPLPGLPALLVSLALMLAMIGLSGGWIATALALVAKKPINDQTWPGGLSCGKRILEWNIALLIWLALIGLFGCQLGLLVIRSGLVASPATSFLAIPSLLSFGGIVIWTLLLSFATYYLAISCIGTVVVVAEPQRKFWSLFGRVPRVFLATASWQGLGELLLLLIAWWCLKTAGSQLLLPFGPIGMGSPALAYSVIGMIFWSGLAVGDALFIMLVIMMAAITYYQGISRLGEQ
ncbi:MAG: hypothetical protein HY692_08220 [Cyanobacteria bacterium NC_groundwater_1444_Ag_S-0.65um_54_12]|nr:hypothetical protein [Cyanobacteria bacterium NC_groundwater_1444_Ag_S-0.65um_54_12]